MADRVTEQKDDALHERNPQDVTASPGARRVTIIERYRVVVVQEAPKRRGWRRWIWTSERKLAPGFDWELQKEGQAWTRNGAVAAARRELPLHCTIDADREELEGAIRRRPLLERGRPSPLQPALLSEHPGERQHPETPARADQRNPE